MKTPRRVPGDSSDDLPLPGGERVPAGTGDAERDARDNELELVRRAYEALQSRVLRERVRLAEQAQEIDELKDDVAALTAECADLRERLAWREEIGAKQHEEIVWRAEVMENQEAQLERIYASSAYRWSAPVRALLGLLQRRGR